MSIIGHNRSFADRFADIMEKYRALGFKGAVSVANGLVMITCENKYDASTVRKALKIALKKFSDVASVETRPTKGFYVFTIKC